MTLMGPVETGNEKETSPLLGIDNESELFNCYSGYCGSASLGFGPVFFLGVPQICKIAQ